MTFFLRGPRSANSFLVSSEKFTRLIDSVPLVLIEVGKQLKDRMKK